MTLSILQLRDEDGERRVAVLEEGRAALIEGIASTHALARSALAENTSLAGAARARRGPPANLEAAEREGRLLPPIDHPDPARLHLTGTGLTHLGSAESRAAMHEAAAAGALTDSMRMFLMGVEGGKPGQGQTGVQPEWFYKGDGGCLVAPGAPLAAPDFALNGGEEPEIAGIYLIDDESRPRRLGFALANEFSDHLTERENYLWLAHSKLRPAALGPELMTGPLPDHIEGVSRIRRGGAVLWEKPFLTGQANMSHSLANIEYHHFKHALCRRPGDVHIHFLGAATLSFADNILAEPGDTFEIAAAPFSMPLRNQLARAPREVIEVTPL